MLFNYVDFKVVKSARHDSGVIVTWRLGQPWLRSLLASPERLSCKNTSSGLEPHTKGQCQLIRGGGVETETGSLCRASRSTWARGCVEPGRQLVMERLAGLGEKEAQLKSSALA